MVFQKCPFKMHIFTRGNAHFRPKVWELKPEWRFYTSTDLEDRFLAIWSMGIYQEAVCLDLRGTAISMESRRISLGVKQRCAGVQNRKNMNGLEAVLMLVLSPVQMNVFHSSTPQFKKTSRGAVMEYSDHSMLLFHERISKRLQDHSSLQYSFNALTWTAAVEKLRTIAYFLVFRRPNEHGSKVDFDKTKWNSWEFLGWKISHGRWRFPMLKATGDGEDFSR